MGKVLPFRKPTWPSGNELVYDPSGGESLRAFIEKNRGPGKRLVVGPDVSMRDFAEAMPKGAKLVQ